MAARKSVPMPNPVMTALTDSFAAAGCEWFLITRNDQGTLLVTDHCVDPKSVEPRHVQITKELGIYKGPFGSDYVVVEDHPSIHLGMYSCLSGS